MSTTSQIADLLEKSGIPFTRVEGVADGIEYWGLSVRHENVHAEVRECSDWVEMKAWHYTPEQFMDMLVGAGTCHIVKTWTDSDYADHWRYSCSECGYQIEVGERDIATGYPTSHANFCWNCGARVVSE